MGTLKSYIIGFILSIALTLAAFIAVINHLFSGSDLILVIMGLALVQLTVQLIFFLHLQHEKGPRWNLAIFLSTVSIVLIIVVGSLWIMYNLNNYHMSPAEVENYILEDEGIHK